MTHGDRRRRALRILSQLAPYFPSPPLIISVICSSPPRRPAWRRSSNLSRPHSLFPSLALAGGSARASSPLKKAYFFTICKVLENVGILCDEDGNYADELAEHMMHFLVNLGAARARSMMTNIGSLPMRFALLLDVDGGSARESAEEIIDVWSKGVCPEAHGATSAMRGIPPQIGLHQQLARRN